MKDLLQKQAQDCARYYLGAQWTATYTGDSGLCFLGTRTEPNIHVGSNWTQVFAKAGVQLPKPPLFVAVGTMVKRFGTNETEAHCSSKTMAQRVANALNEYQPGPRGY